MKKTIALWMVALLLCTGWAGATSQTTRPIEIYVNGQRVFTDTAPVLINGRTYVPIRAISEAMGINNIKWNSENSTATVTGSTFQMQMSVGKQHVSSNGRYFYAEDGVILMQNRVMVPIRVFANATGASVEWNAQYRRVYIRPSDKPVRTADQSYIPDELYWLSRIINAESSGESLAGKIGVGNVILNRVASPEYPNTVRGVIFDTNYGVQFEPTRNGTIYNAPSEEAVIAAKICLEGYDTIGDSLYFLNESTAKNMWIVNNRPYYTTIGNHSFYN